MGTGTTESNLFYLLIVVQHMPTGAGGGGKGRPFSPGGGDIFLKSRATTKSTLFAVSTDEWHTKKDTGKSMKNALYILRYSKRHQSS